MKGPIPYTCDGFFLGRSVLSGPVTASALDDLVVRLSLEASVKKLTSTEESRCSVRVSCDGVSLYNQRKDEGFESDVESTSSEGGGSPKPGAVTEDTSSANSSGTESDLDLRPRADQPLDVSSSDSTDVSLPSTSSTGTSNRSLDVSWALGSVLFCHVASRHPSSVAWVTRTHGSADLEVVVVETKHSDTAQALYNAFDAHTRTDRLYRPLKKRDSANGSGGVSINNVIVPPVSAASSKKSSGHASSSSPSPIPPSWNLIQHTDPSGVTHIEIECAQSLVNAANNGPVPSLPIVPLAFNDAPRSKEPATTAVVAAPANRAVTSLSATPLPKESPPRRLQEEREENTSEILSISTPDPPEQYGSLNRRLLKSEKFGWSEELRLVGGTSVRRRNFGWSEELRLVGGTSVGRRNVGWSEELRLVGGTSVGRRNVGWSEELRLVGGTSVGRRNFGWSEERRLVGGTSVGRRKFGWSEELRLVGGTSVCGRKFGCSAYKERPVHFIQARDEQKNRTMNEMRASVAVVGEPCPLLCTPQPNHRSDQRNDIARTSATTIARTSATESPTTTVRFHHGCHLMTIQFADQLLKLVGTTMDMPKFYFEDRGKGSQSIDNENLPYSCLTRKGSKRRIFDEWIEDFPSISDVVPFRTKGSKDLGSADASSSNLEDRPQPQASSPPTATKVLLRLTDGQYLIPTKTGIEPHRTAYPKESHVVRGRYVRCSVSPYEFFPQCVFHGSTVTSEYFPSQQGPLDFPAAPAEPPHRDRKWLMDEQLLSSPPQRGIVGNRRRSRSKSPVRTRQGIKVANYVLPIQQKFREFSDTMKKFKEDVRSSMLSLGAGDQDIGGTDSTIMANGSNGVSDDTTDRLRALRITTTTTTELDFSVRSCVRRSERKKSNRGPSVEEASIASSKTPSSKRSVTFGDYAVVQLFDDDGVRRS
ncbi:unnamed protein product [Cyprideis torosa]|uniref:Uncharacterized protein n=1 Tax=Cyprideis torosa TaxID=163714 RepID=A0A7R8W7I7_9CRUS|nr:unnamed protein product [Cyprideis torosa]CAG0882765.1 unnamed protein product [Cyprideis torosa]